PPPPRSPLFPYTTLFRSRIKHHGFSHQCIAVNFLNQLARWLSQSRGRCLRTNHQTRAIHARLRQRHIEGRRDWSIQPKVAHVSHDTHNLRSEEHTSELQSRFDLVCRLLLEKKKITRCL